MYYFNLPNFQIVGSSPEILVRLRSDLITLRPIAGTRPRGKNIKQDRKYELDLLSDEKETSEHLMLLDLGRNDVGKVAKKSTVSVTAKFIIEKYSHVMHLVSNVTGKLKKNISTIEALMAGFPAGTVSGAPKIRAMQIIDELETDVRGIYAGGIGYISPDGDMDTCIVLRTGIITKNKLYVQAGGGVVYDSDPELEYMETVNKAKAVLNAAEIVLGNDL
jgi:anthranilate synthase component 1